MSDEKKTVSGGSSPITVPVQQQADSLTFRIQTVRQWIDQQHDELAKALPKGMDPTRFSRVALTSVLRNPKLAECSRASFVLAIMESAQLGLEPDSVSGLAYLVPFKGVATLVVGYRGLIQLAYRHPSVIGLGAFAVHEKDVIEVEYGLRPRLRHVPALSGDPGPVIGAYAVAQIRGGGRPFVYQTREEIDAHRARSRAKDEGPWVTDFEAMARKTPMRS